MREIVTAQGGNGGIGFVDIRTDPLGPNQLAWLREHMLYNGVRIFEHWEKNKVVRVSS